MTTLSTHDTKRGEDVRARLAVLSEMPAEWTELVGQLMAAAPIPDPTFGYLLWQTFVGAGFIERERMHAYAEKAMREAAQGTTWIDPDAEFEAAVHAAVDAAYDSPAVREPLAAFIERITPYGWTNSLAQKLVQLTMPGVPDVYQGTELWEDSLVDPDNRRAVDFDARRAMLDTLDGSRRLLPRRPRPDGGAPSPLRGTPPHCRAAADRRLRRREAVGRVAHAAAAPRLAGPVLAVRPGAGRGGRGRARGGLRPRRRDHRGDAGCRCASNATAAGATPRSSSRGEPPTSSRARPTAAASRSPTCSPITRWRCSCA